MKQPVRVLHSGLTDRFYAVTRYTEKDGGLIEAQTKHDVTADVQGALMAFAGDLWNALENCREFWSQRPDAGLIEEHISRFEKVAGIGGNPA